MTAETKHTPGPWLAEVSAAKVAWIQGSNGEWAALACGETDASAAANARLIAAAPDMLEALTALVERDARVDGGTLLLPIGNHGTAVAVLNRARAAIAKATGGDDAAR